MNLRFYLFISGVNQGNKKGEESKISLLPQGLWSFPSVFSPARWRNLVSVVCLYMITSMVMDFEVDANLGDGFYYYCFFCS